MKNNNQTVIKCTGYNLSKFINSCVSSDIALNNTSRHDVKTLEFSLDDKNLKKFKKLNFNDYDIKIEKVGGFNKLINTLIYRSGLILGLIFSIIAFFFINNRLLNIEINGLINYNEEDIVTEINNYGLGYFDNLNINIKDLENHLTNSFDFSFVSIITKGSSLIINVKEEISDITENYLPITADYNMVITSINVYAGYSDKKVGDIVYKGDTIVYPYEIINNEKISIIPMVEIFGDIYFSSRYSFKSEEDITIRTGNKKIISSSFYLGKNKLFESEKENVFENYEIEEVEELISYYFLPIKIKKTIAYELSTEKKINNFYEEKDGIIENLRKDVYSKVPENFTVDEEKIEISSVNNGNIITIYLKSSVYLKYK